MGWIYIPQGRHVRNILITGANGQLGCELRALVESEEFKINNSRFLTLNPQFTFATREALDLSNLCAIERFFEGKTFDAIINCAAYTAVDKAESERELADTINHRFVSMLAKIAKRDNAKLIHISTDYVFDGKNNRPYIESDPTNPQGVYGQTKRDGENAILAVSPENTIIIRTSWVYSSFGNNFVKTMLCLVDPITTDQYPTPATRPHFSLLNKNKIKSEYNINIPYWRDSLANCLKEMW
ncbi:MAG: sugar nucleotide-binding protein [Epsilonproteobacteria bacterium]|nr:sugar nucleotide-binding protein [Campylobacterota bacterium]